MHSDLNSQTRRGELEGETERKRIPAQDPDIIAQQSDEAVELFTALVRKVSHQLQLSVCEHGGVQQIVWNKPGRSSHYSLEPRNEHRIMPRNKPHVTFLYHLIQMY